MTKEEIIAKFKDYQCLGCKKPVKLRREDLPADAFTPKAMEEKRHVVVCTHCGEIMDFNTTDFTIKLLTASEFVRIPYEQAMDVASISQRVALRNKREQEITE